MLCSACPPWRANAPARENFRSSEFGTWRCFTSFRCDPSRSSRFQTLLADLSQTSPGLHHAPPSQKSFSFSPLVLRKDAAPRRPFRVSHIQPSSASSELRPEAPPITSCHDNGSPRGRLDPIRKQPHV